MLHTRARKTIAGLALSASMVLGTTAAVQAAPADRSTDTGSQVVAKTPAAKKVKKLSNVKKKAAKIAVKKTKKYASVQRYLTNNSAKIPPAILDTANAQVAKGSKRVNKLTVKVAKAKKVKRAKVLRGKLKAQRPDDVKSLVKLAERAIAAGDVGTLEGILNDLLGLDLDESLLGPVVELVDGLLDGLLGGGVGGDGVGGLLDGVLELLDNLLGGLLGGLLGR